MKDFHIHLIFTVYTSQDVEKDNECIPPQPTTKLPLTIIPGSHNSIDRMPTGTVETFLVGGTGRHQINAINSVTSTILSCELNATNGGSSGLGLGNFNGVSRKDWNQEIEISTVAGGFNQKLEINEFVGVGGLDILQGVSKGELI